MLISSEPLDPERFQLEAEIPRAGEIPSAEILGSLHWASVLTDWSGRGAVPQIVGQFNGPQVPLQDEALCRTIASCGVGLASCRT